MKFSDNCCFHFLSVYYVSGILLSTLYLLPYLLFTVNLQGKYYYRLLQVFPAFQKFALCHFAFTKLVLLFANRKKSEEAFFILTRSGKPKQCSECFSVNCYRVYHPASSLGPYSASTHHSFEICAHLCLISIYFVKLLARCVLRYQKSLRDLIKVLSNLIKE